MNVFYQIPGIAQAYSLFEQSDVVYRLQQEGYYFLIILLVFFILSLIVSNTLAYLLTLFLRLAQLFLLVITPKQKS